MKNCLSLKKNLSKSGIFKLVEHKDFKAELFHKISKKDLELKLSEKESLIVLEGRVHANIELNQFDSAISFENTNSTIGIEDGTSFVLVSENH